MIDLIKAIDDMEMVMRKPFNTLAVVLPPVAITKQTCRRQHSQIKIITMTTRGVRYLHQFTSKCSSKCGTPWGWEVDDFGASYAGSTNYFAFESTVDTPCVEEMDIGIATINAVMVKMTDDWGSVATLDALAILSDSGWGYPVNMLLYRDVPKQSIVELFTAGLSGIGLVRRRQS